MKIGMIVYSESGNTLSVVKKLEKKLVKNKFNVIIDRIELTEKYNPNKPFRFKNIPDIRGYDVLVLGSPVEAFSLSRVAKKYLSGIKSFEKRKVYLLVTQYFPYPWLGGNNAIRIMKKEVEAKDGEVMDAGIINWTKKKRYLLEDKLVDKFVESIIVNIDR